MLMIHFEWHGSFPDIPKFYGLVMASHKAILFVGVVVDINDIFSPRTIDNIFLPELLLKYVLVFLSKTLTYL